MRCAKKQIEKNRSNERYKKRKQQNGFVFHLQFGIENEGIKIQTCSQFLLLCGYNLRLIFHEVYECEHQ